MFKIKKQPVKPERERTTYPYSIGSICSIQRILELKEEIHSKKNLIENEMYGYTIDLSIFDDFSKLQISVDYARYYSKKEMVLFIPCYETDALYNERFTEWKKKMDEWLDWSKSNADEIEKEIARRESQKELRKKEFIDKEIKKINKLIEDKQRLVNKISAS